VVQRRFGLSQSASHGAGVAWDFARMATFPPARASRREGMSNSDADPGAADVGATQQDPTPDAEPEADLVGPTGPACAHPGKNREMFLQPIFLRTSAADPAPTGTSWMTRYAMAAAVWSKLGVSVGARDAITLDTPLKSSGADNHEANQVAALHSATDVDVLLVDNDMSWTGGAATFPVGGGAGSQTVISDRGTSQTLLAHEVGHVLGLGHPPGRCRSQHRHAGDRLQLGRKSDTEYHGKLSSYQMAGANRQDVPVPGSLIFALTRCGQRTR